MGFGSFPLIYVHFWLKFYHTIPYLKIYYRLLSNL
jgi:hypothetical protein